MFLTSSTFVRSCYKALPSTDSVLEHSQLLARKQPSQPFANTAISQMATPSQPIAPRPAGLRRTSSLRKGAQQLKRGSSYVVERTNPFALHEVVEEEHLRAVGGWW